MPQYKLVTRAIWAADGKSFKTVHMYVDEQNRPLMNAQRLLVDPRGRPLQFHEDGRSAKPCGAQTACGRACRRRVKGGGRCAQH